MLLHLLLGALQAGQDVVHLEGLGEVVEHALLHRLDRGLDARVGGEEDHGHAGANLLDFREQLHAVHRRHAQVRDRDVDAALVDDGERGGAVAGRLDLVAIGLEQTLQKKENPRFVVD